MGIMFERIKKNKIIPDRVQKGEKNGN